MRQNARLRPGAPHSSTPGEHTALPRPLARFWGNKGVEKGGDDRGKGLGRGTEGKEKDREEEERERRGEGQGEEMKGKGGRAPKIFHRHDASAKF